MKGHSILLVEDYQDTRRALAKLLNTAGYQVQEAQTAEDGLALLRGEPLAALVLLDLTLPGMSGIEMLRIMRKEPRTAAVPVVVHSASDEYQYQAAALAEGAS